jgi:hypothetical protein
MLQVKPFLQSLIVVIFAATSSTRVVTVQYIVVVLVLCYFSYEQIVTVTLMRVHCRHYIRYCCVYSTSGSAKMLHQWERHDTRLC